MHGSATVHLNRCLPDCCFQEAGIVALALPTNFNRIGSAACASCWQQTVGLSQTDVLEILGSTFARCSQLQQLCLPRSLRTIEQEAFFKCISLQEVSIPPSLLYIARHAFAGCTQLCSNKKKAQHGEEPVPSPMLLTNVSNSTSPRGSEFCRSMLMIFGENTF